MLYAFVVKPFDLFLAILPMLFTDRLSAKAILRGRGNGIFTGDLYELKALRVKGEIKIALIGRHMQRLLSPGDVRHYVK